MHDLRGEVRGGPRSAAIDHERRLVEDHLGDIRSAGGGVERQRRAGAVAEDQHGPARIPDQRVDILDLALDRVRLMVATRPAAAPVVNVRREPRLQG